MTYIDLSFKTGEIHYPTGSTRSRSHYPFRGADKFMIEAREWLNEYAGRENSAWHFQSGEIYASGVYIRNAKVAAEFRAKFLL